MHSKVSVNHVNIKKINGAGFESKNHTSKQHKVTDGLQVGKLNMPEYMLLESGFTIENLSSTQ